MLMKRLIAGTALSLALALPVAGYAADSSTRADAASPTVIKSDKLMHADVRNPQGDKIGSVEGVLLDHDGQTRAVIVDVGGFLGMGEHRVALDWDDLQVANNGDKVVSKYTKDQLKVMPEYKYPDEKHRNTAYYDPNYRTSSTRVASMDRSTTDWHRVTGAVHAKKLIDAKVRSGTNENVGEVSDALVDPSGKVRAVIVDIGGFLGVGTRRVALDYDKLQLSESGDDLRLTTALTKDQLKALPEYDEKMAAAMNSASASSRSAGGSSSRRH